MTLLWPAATDVDADDITRMPDQGIGSGSSQPPGEIFAVRLVYRVYDESKDRLVTKRQNWLYRKLSDAKKHHGILADLNDDPTGPEIVELELLVGGIEWFPMPET